MAKTVTATAQDTITGPYGGTAIYTINVNESSGAFSGNLTFSAYTGDQDSSVTGEMLFSGVYNSSSQAFTSISISFSYLAMTEEGGASYTAGGEHKEREYLAGDKERHHR